MKPDQRMRLDSLAMVNRIADARRALLYKISLVEDVPADDVPDHRWQFRMLIDGDMVTSAMMALVRPIVARELKAQVEQLDRDLRALGVDV